VISYKVVRDNKTQKKLQINNKINNITTNKVIIKQIISKNYKHYATEIMTGL